MSSDGGLGVGLSRLFEAPGASGSDAAIRLEIRAIHRASRGTYGRPRMVQALHNRSYTIGHKRVARLMREEMLRGKSKPGSNIQRITGISNPFLTMC